MHLDQFAYSAIRGTGPPLLSSSHLTFLLSDGEGVQVEELQSRMQAAASRGAEEVDEIRRSCEERMSAMRSELEQQEVDKAALLDIVQVHLCTLLSINVSHRLEQLECPHAAM